MHQTKKLYALGAAAVFASTALGALAGFVSLYFLTQILSQEDFGGYTFAFSLTTFVSFITLWGFERGLLLSIAGFGASDRQHMRGRRLLKRALTTTAVFAILACVALWVGRDAISERAAVSSAAFWVPALAALLLPLTMSGILQAWFRSNHQAPLASLTYGLTDTLRAALIGLVFWFDAGPVGVAGAVVLAAFFPVVVLGLASRRSPDLPPHRFEDSPLATGPVLIANRIAHHGLRVLDVILVGLIVDGVSTAIYAVATRIASFCHVGSEALQPTFSARVREAVVGGDLGKAISEYQMARAAAFLVSLSIAILLIGFGPWLLDLLGGFDAALPPMIILTAGAMFAAGAPLLFVFSTGMGDLYAPTALRVATLAVFVASAVPLTRLYGPIGAASAMALTHVATVALIQMYLRVRVGVWIVTWPSFLLPALAFGAAMLTAFGHLERGWLLVVLLLIGGATFVFDPRARKLPELLLSRFWQRKT